MNIAYITRARMPTEKAHGLQIAKMCEAYADLGHKVTLIVPQRENAIADDIFTYYGLRENFTITYIDMPDTIKFSGWIPFLAFWVQAVWFLVSLRKVSLPLDTLIMTRSPEVAWWFSQKKYSVLCELHEWSRTKGRIFAYLLRQVKYVISNSEGTATSARAYGIESKVAPNGVDLDALRPTRQRDEMRSACGIGKDEFVVMYIGALEDWKGYLTLLKASVNLAPMRVTIVGGKESHVLSLRHEYPHVTFFGFKPYREIGNYQNMADVLVIPNDPSFVEAQAHTSPIKLFMYLASGVPVVVTDLPTIRTVVGDDEVTFFDGSVHDLIVTIHEVKEHAGESKEKAEHGKVLAQKYSWRARGEEILKII